MILVANTPIQGMNGRPVDPIEQAIFDRMLISPVLYSFPTMDGVRFELTLRKNIIARARRMNDGQASFAVFLRSTANPQFWTITPLGGLQQRADVTPSAAVSDIDQNSSLYGFECATAMVILMYQGVLDTIGSALFNRYFPNLLLYSWHFDTDLGLRPIDTVYFLPGDILYINNPDFDPSSPEWRGENVIDMGDGTYFGHGIGIYPAEQIIATLNGLRRPGALRSAYMTETATRPNVQHLYQLSTSREATRQKAQYPIVPHNEASIAFSRYCAYLHAIYTQSLYP